MPKDDSSLPASDPASAFVSGLVDLGVDPSVARGAISYSVKNENMGGDPQAVNPSSGASYFMQWLGSRKNAIEGKYGVNPSVEQQVQHMKDELQGSEGATLSRLLSAKAGDAASGYSIWGTSYERPGASALAKAGLTSGGALRSASTGFGLPSTSLGGVPADFGQVRSSALAALAPQQEEGVPAAGAAPSAWQRLMTLSMISKLSSQGTHSFQAIDYDPFKVAQAGKKGTG